MAFLPFGFAVDFWPNDDDAKQTKL